MQEDGSVQELVNPWISGFHRMTIYEIHMSAPAVQLWLQAEIKHQSMRHSLLPCSSGRLMRMLHRFSTKTCDSNADD